MYSKMYAKRVVPDGATMKTVLEICLDQEGFDISKSKMKDMEYEEYISNLLLIKTKRKSLTPSELSLALRNLGNKRTYLLIMEGVVNEFKLNKEQLRRLENRYNKFLAEYKLSDIVSQYSKTKLMYSVIKNSLEKLKRSGKLNIKAVSPELIDVIQDDFSKFVIGSTTKQFNIGTITIAYLTNTLNNFYLKGRGSNLLYSTVNRAGTALQVNGENGAKEENFTDFLDIEDTEVPEFTDFKEVAEGILSASEQLYSHNREVFYDLFSRVKLSKLTDVYNELLSILKIQFKATTASSMINYFDSDYISTLTDSDKYRRGIYNARENNLLKYVERFMSKSYNVNRLSALYNKLIEIQNQNPTENGRAFFRPAGMKIKNGELTNDEKFFQLVFGFGAVQRLVDYLHRADIDIFSVPSFIFRDRKYLDRFNTFKEYYTLHSMIKQVVDEAGTDFVELPDNDEVKNYITAGNLNNISKIQFVSIKHAINIPVSSEKENKRACHVIQDKQADLNALAKKYLSNILAMHIKHHKILTTLKMMNNHALKYVEAGTLKHHIVDYNENGVPTRWYGFPKEYMSIAERTRQESGTLPKSLPSDDELYYNILRYNSLLISLLSLTFSMIYDSLQVKNDLQFADFCSKYNEFLNLPDSIDSIVYVTSIMGSSDVHAILDEFPSKLRSVYGDGLLKIIFNALNNIQDVETRKSTTVAIANGLYSSSVKPILCETHISVAELDNYYPTIYNESIKYVSGVIAQFKRITSDFFQLVSNNFNKSDINYEKYQEKLKQLVGYLELFKDSESRTGNTDFAQLLREGTLDSNGYMFYNDKPITKRMGNLLYFLHESGNWVTPEKDYELSKCSVGEDERIFI